MAIPKYTAGHFHPGYNDIVSTPLNERGLELFDQLILDRLPDDAAWCGDEILRDCVWDEDSGRYTKGEQLDLNVIIESAAEELMSNYSEREDIWKGSSL